MTTFRQICFIALTALTLHSSAAYADDLSDELYRTLMEIFGEALKAVDANQSSQQTESESQAPANNDVAPYYFYVMVEQEVNEPSYIGHHTSIIRDTLDFFAPKLNVPKFVKRFYEADGEDSVDLLDLTMTLPAKYIDTYKQSHDVFIVHELGHLIFIEGIDAYYLEHDDWSYDARLAKVSEAPRKEFARLLRQYPGQTFSNLPPEENPFLVQDTILTDGRKNTRGDFKDSFLYRSKPNQEVFADLTAAIKFEDPKAVSRHLSGWDNIARDFSYANYRQIIDNEDFQMAQALDYHLKSLLRWQIYDEYYRPSGRSFGHNASYDKQVASNVLSYMSPIHVRVRARNPDAPIAPLAAAMAMRLKMPITNENFSSLLAKFLMTYCPEMTLMLLLSQDFKEDVNKAFLQQPVLLKSFLTKHPRYEHLVWPSAKEKLRNLEQAQNPDREVVRERVRESSRSSSANNRQMRHGGGSCEGGFRQ